MLIAPRWRRRADSSVAFVRLLRLLLLLRVERSVARAASLIAHGGKEREGKRKRKTRDSKKKKSETVLVDLDLDLFSYSPLSLRTNWTPVRAFLFSLSLFLTTKRTKKRYLIEKRKVGTFHLSLFLCFSPLFFLSLQNEKKRIISYPSSRFLSALQLLRERVRDGVHERRRRQVLVRGHLGRAVHADRQIFSHRPRLDRLDDRGLERVAESLQLAVGVELGPVRQPARPREDRRHRVGRRRVALLVLAPVARDGPVRRLGLHGLPVRRHEHRGHQAERAVALRDDV